MDKPRMTISGILIKTVVTHSVTYFFIGWSAYSFFSHVSLPGGGGPDPFMRLITDPLVRSATALQVIRGLLFGIVFWLLREPLFGRKNGGAVLWLTLVVLGILGTFGPVTGSLEGMFFTTRPLLGHLYGLPEILLQSLFLSLILFYWINHPRKGWFSWIMGVVYTLIIIVTILGLIINAA